MEDILYTDPNIEELKPEQFVPGFPESIGSIFSWSAFEPIQRLTFERDEIVATPQLLVKDEVEGITTIEELQERVSANFSMKAKVIGFGNASAAFSYTNVSKSLSTRQYFRVRMLRRFGSIKVLPEKLPEQLRSNLLIINGVVLGMFLFADFSFEYDSSVSKTNFGGSLSGSMSYGLFSGSAKGAYERALQTGNSAMKVDIKVTGIGLTEGMEFGGDDAFQRFEDYVNEFNKKASGIMERIRSTERDQLMSLLERETAIGVSIAELQTDRRVLLKTQRLTDLFAKLEFLFMDLHANVESLLAIRNILDSEDRLKETETIFTMDLYTLDGSQTLKKVKVSMIGLQELALVMLQLKTKVLDFMHLEDSSTLESLCRELVSDFKQIFTEVPRPSVEIDPSLGGILGVLDNEDQPLDARKLLSNFEDLLSFFNVEECNAEEAAINEFEPYSNFGAIIASFDADSVIKGLTTMETSFEADSVTKEFNMLRASFDADNIISELNSNFLAIFRTYKTIQIRVSDYLLAYNVDFANNINAFCEDKFIRPAEQGISNVSLFGTFLQRVVNKLGWYSDQLLELLKVEKFLIETIDVYDCLSPVWQQRLNLAAYPRTFNADEVIGQWKIVSVHAIVNNYRNKYLNVNGTYDNFSYVGVYQDAAVEGQPVFSIERAGDNNKVVIKIANYYVSVYRKAREHYPSSGGLPGYNLKLVETQDENCEFGVFPILVKIDGVTRRCFMFTQNLESLKIYNIDEKCATESHTRAAYMCPFDTNSSCAWFLEG